MASRIDVELDIFSGMPNPTWVLTTAEAKELERRLAALPPTAAGQLSGKLGYRGLVLHVTGDPATRLIQIQSGGVHITKGETTVHVRDEARDLERWLIGTGRAHLPEQVIETVDRELR